MKKTDLAYLAGFFDGEGTICLDRNLGRPNKMGHRRSRLQLRVEVGQCNRWIVERFRIAFGGYIQFLPRGGNSKPFWIWVSKAKTAGEFLETIYPYLILKQSEAKVALEFQHARKVKSPGPKGLSAEEHAVEEAQRLLLHNLKDKSAY